MNGDNGQPQVPMSNGIEISIVFDPNTGRVLVNGPINEKILCLGIMEMAKRAIMDFNPATTGGGILVPKMQIVPGGKR